ncbi:MAG: tryptophan-rich sensory protein [Anaerolineae bacterium]
MKKNVLRQIIVVLALVATIAINGLANALPLNNLTTGEISDQFQVYFVPAGYVFSIWGLIYLALATYAVYQALPAQRENPRLSSIIEPFALSCVANVAWLFLWHYQMFPLTLVAMLALLLLLIVIYLRLGIGRTLVSTAEKWLVHIPFSIYLGWTTVATIANVTTVLDSLGWDGWGAPQVWAVVMLIVGAIIASAMGLTRGDVAYMLVVVWAFVGIAVEHATTSLVSVAAWLMAALVAVMAVVGPLFHKNRITTQSQ